LIYINKNKTKLYIDIDILAVWEFYPSCLRRAHRCRQWRIIQTSPFILCQNFEYDFIL